MNRYNTNAIYTANDGESFFVSPDGVGRVFYDTRVEAAAEHGNLPLIHATAAQLEDGWSDTEATVFATGDSVAHVSNPTVEFGTVEFGSSTGANVTELDGDTAWFVAEDIVKL